MRYLRKKLLLRICVKNFCYANFIFYASAQSRLGTDFDDHVGLSGFLGKPFNFQQLGCCKKTGKLFLHHVDLALVHEFYQSCQVIKLYVPEDDDWVLARIFLQEELLFYKMWFLLRKVIIQLNLEYSTRKKKARFTKIVISKIL